MGYAPVLLGIPAFLVFIYGIGEVGSFNFTFFRQPLFLGQCLALATLLIALLRISKPARPWFEGNLRFRIIIVVLIFFLSSAALSLVNKVFISRKFERTAFVIDRSIRSPWGAKGKATRPPICKVEFASGIDPERRIPGIIDCEIWYRLDPAAAAVIVRTEIGITGLEFSKVLGVDAHGPGVIAPAPTVLLPPPTPSPTAVVRRRR